jgi:hypothetical protein
MLLSLCRTMEAKELIAEGLELARELEDEEFLDGLRTLAAMAAEIDRA